jgi:hypothetical protein
MSKATGQPRAGIDALGLQVCLLVNRCLLVFVRLRGARRQELLRSLRRHSRVSRIDLDNPAVRQFNLNH